jgi:hypothetical protein
MATEEHLNAAYGRVHEAGEKYQAGYLSLAADQGALDQMRADVKRLGAEYERIADESGLSQEDRLAWRHYLA